MQCAVVFHCSKTHQITQRVEHHAKVLTACASQNRAEKTIHCSKAGAFSGCDVTALTGGERCNEVRHVLLGLKSTIG